MLLMLLFNDLYVCFHEQPNIAELKKLFNKFIFELDDKANDKLLLNAQKRRHLRKKKKEYVTKGYPLFDRVVRCP